VDINKKVLTTHEVARYLNVFTNTVIHWMNNGKLGGYKTPGGHRRVPREELLRFIKENNLENCTQLNTPSKLLIVEDDEDTMDLYISILQKENYEIKKAYTGFAAGVASDFMPDLIILDIMLPDVDGFTILELLKKENHLKDVKILAVSAISDSDTIKKLYELGINGFMNKPFSILDFKQKIRSLLDEPVPEPATILS
jgi:excisionase family DNA binding protein